MLDPILDGDCRGAVDPKQVGGCLLQLLMGVSSPGLKDLLHEAACLSGGAGGGGGGSFESQSLCLCFSSVCPLCHTSTQALHDWSLILYTVWPVLLKINGFLLAARSLVAISEPGCDNRTTTEESRHYVTAVFWRSDWSGVPFGPVDERSQLLVFKNPESCWVCLCRDIILEVCGFMRAVGRRKKSCSSLCFEACFYQFVHPHSWFKVLPTKQCLFMGCVVIYTSNTSPSDMTLNMTFLNLWQVCFIGPSHIVQVNRINRYNTSVYGKEMLS